MKHILVFLAAAAFTFLSGCVSNRSNDTGTRIVVQTAIVGMIEHAGRPAQKAQQVVETISLIKGLLNDTATVGKLRIALLTRVNERALTPGERMLALEVVETIATEIEARVGKGTLSPSQITTVNDVLGWALTAAQIYVSN